MGVGPRIVDRDAALHVLRVCPVDVARHDATLIVVGSPVTQGVLGSVEPRLLGDAPCPIVTVFAPPDDAVAAGA